MAKQEVKKEPTPLEKMTNLTRRLVAVPKSEISKRTGVAKRRKKA